MSPGTNSESSESLSEFSTKNFFKLFSRSQTCLLHHRQTNLNAQLLSWRNDVDNLRAHRTLAITLQIGCDNSYDQSETSGSLNFRAWNQSMLDGPHSRTKFCARMLWFPHALSSSRIGHFPLIFWCKYGELPVQCQNWFARYRSRNFDVKDEPRPGRPIVEKVDEILQKIEVDRHIVFHLATSLRN